MQGECYIFLEYFSKFKKNIFAAKPNHHLSEH